MNKLILNKLFKPHVINYQSIGALFNEKEDEILLMEIMIDVECDKSKNEVCANTDCYYNLINVHESDLYKRTCAELENKYTGDTYASESD